MTNILVTEKLRRTFYVGVTSTLSGRVAEHRAGTIKGFTQKYNLHHLGTSDGTISISRSRGRSL